MSDQPVPPPEGKLITAALHRMRPKVTVREAARRTGISEGWWRQIVKGRQPISGGGSAPLTGPAETVARMAQTVGVTPEELEEAGRQDAAQELRELTPARTRTDQPSVSDEDYQRALDLMAEGQRLIQEAQRVLGELRQRETREDRRETG